MKEEEKLTFKEEVEEVEKESFMNKRSQFILNIVGAAIFGALSAVTYPIYKSFIDPFRIQGLAPFDPVSIIWMFCFLIFGPYAGILCCTIGFITIIPYDTSIFVIGPFLKFSATIPLIIVPTLILRLYKNGNTSQKLLKLKNYLISAVISIIVRILLLLLLDTIVYLMFYGRDGLEAFLVAVVIVNTTTSILDLFVPYTVVKGLNLYKQFDIW